MTQTLARLMMVAALAGVGTACATTPTYPTQAAQQSPTVDAPVVAPTKPAPPTPIETNPAPAAPAVESQPLPPVATPSVSPQPAPSAPPPLQLAPLYAPAPAYTPPAAYAPARPRTMIHYLAGGKVVEAKGMYRDYEVRKGDHVDAIARDLKTTRAVIVDANHLKAPYPLRPGQHIKVPVAKAYEAQSGDSLTVIAKRFDVSLGELAALNDLPEYGRLRAGERIALPANYHDRGPSKIRLPAEEASVAARAPGNTGTGYRPTPYYAHAARPSTSQPPRAAPAPYIAHPYTPPPQASYTPIKPQPAPVGVVSESAITAAARGRFVWPVHGDILSNFGAKGIGRSNDGVDLRAPLGTAIHAAAAGEVVYAGNQVPGFGNLVLLKHADGWVTAYAHLDKIAVQMRQGVTQGQVIGEVGATGGVSEPQLHFEVRYAPTAAEKARPINPILVLPRREGEGGRAY